MGGRSVLRSHIKIGWKLIGFGGPLLLLSYDIPKVKMCFWVVESPGSGSEGERWELLSGPPPFDVSCVPYSNHGLVKP